MWISRWQYERLIERIEVLEKIAVENRIEYGHVIASGLPDKWHSGRGCGSISGTQVPMADLLTRIANYLGFKMSFPVPGGLVDPPKLWLDIHDRSPAPPDTVRIPTGNKTRIKRGKTDNE